MDLKKILPENGPPINEVNKYIEKYKNDLIVIKYGGNVLIDRNIFDNFIILGSIQTFINPYAILFFYY